MRAGLRDALLIAGTFGIGSIYWACATAVVTDDSTPTEGGVSDAGLGGDGNCTNNQEGCKCTSAVDCYEGPMGTANKGICKYGKRACTMGHYGPCTNAVYPTTEVCNGLDNNCNGVVGDVPMEGGAPIGTFEDASVYCYTSDPGICKNGDFACVPEAGTAPTCVDIVPPMTRTETCNGLDDDCNGMVDDGLDMGPGSCTISSLKGLCASGDDQCIMAVDTCVQTNFPKAEVCNNKDDNCNGLIDDGSNLCPAFETCVGGTCIFFCPYVFSYDGKKFAYETSVGGASVVGKKSHLIEGKEVEFEPMWARLDHGQVDYSSGTGVVRTKLMAAEDEIVYFDQASLTVVETPPGYEVISTSSIQYNTLGTKDPQKLYGLRTTAMRDPVHATWMGMRDVTRVISRIDDKATLNDKRADNFYELDFGQVHDVSEAQIVIDGWKYKEPRNLRPGVAQTKPHIDVLQADGSWQKALEISTPRGDKKTVAFSLSGVKFPTGQYRMRVYTGTHEDGNAMWYVDRVRLSEEAPLPLTGRDIPMTSANLDFMGVPSQADEAHHDHPRFAFDDGKGELLPDQRTWGKFTRYGDVRDLLASSDDRMVVMRRGDGVELRFEGVPRASAGKVITAFFETDLLFKPRKWMESDKGTDLTQNVAPLPFHGMGRYPYAAPARYPDDESHAKYLREYETREYKPGDPRWGR